MANTYFIEYQFTKNQHTHNGVLEVEANSLPTERIIRKEIAYWTNKSRVQDLCYTMTGAVDNNGKKLEAAE
jgi:hypothetical protein